MKIAVIGDYNKNRPSHIATSEAIQQGAKHISQELWFQWLPTRFFENKDYLNSLENYDGIWGAPGEHKSSLGYINAIQLAREKNIPYLGT